MLHGYTALDMTAAPTLDLMVDLEKILGHRIGLEAVAKATINAPKIADGLQAIKWWKQRKMIEIAEYCCFDVKITKEVHEYGRDHGEIFFMDRLGQKRRVEVSW